MNKTLFESADLSVLTDKQREVVKMYLEGNRQCDIAEKLGTSKQNIASILSRAEKNVRCGSGNIYKKRSNEDNAKRQRVYREKDLDKSREINRRSYHKNKESRKVHMREYYKKYYQEHKDALRERNKQYRQEHKKKED